MSAGAEIRRQLGIGPDEIALLFVGRLSYHAKAHPLPMYLAAEEVARRSRQRMNLLHFGWFANATLKAHFASAAPQLCPSVDVHFLDERQDSYQGLWHAADIFMSLSDNIQETFGLSPLEAMAAGLPQIVTDWNGYRDTVRDGLDGFRVPTAMPPPGAGEELATRYALGIDNYDAYVGNASQTVAVDVAGCIAALERLVKNPDLRHSLGESGRRRALAAFDWRIVIPLHQALWLELAARRRAAPSAAATTFSHPLRPDPFRLFAGYASRTLNANCTIELGPQAAPERFRELAAHPMNHFAHAILGSQNEVQSILDAVARAGSLRVGELLRRNPGLPASGGFTAPSDGSPNWTPSASRARALPPLVADASSHQPRLKIPLLHAPTSLERAIVLFRGAVDVSVQRREVRSQPRLHRVAE